MVALLHELVRPPQKKPWEQRQARANHGSVGHSMGVFHLEHLEKVEPFPIQGLGFQKGLWGSRDETKRTPMP